MTSPLLTKLAAVVEMAGWQPIETAPKDGTEILCWSESNQRLYVLAWHKHNWLEHEIDGNWGRCPTHWMPLPATPSSRQLVPALAGMVKAAWLAIEGARHGDDCNWNRDGECDCWRGTALATLTQEIERLKL